MRICQTKEKNKFKNSKKMVGFFTIIFVLLSLIISSILFANKTLAIGEDPYVETVGADIAGEMTAIKTSAPQTVSQIISAKIKAAMDVIKEIDLDKAYEAARQAGGDAFKAALGNFLNNLAYETATYLATGNEGQSPMFETRPYSKVISDAADNAAGTFIEKLGKKNGLIEFNLCTPNPAVLLKINLGLNNNLKPKAPACTFSQLTKNWDTALKDKDFLPKFQDMFNPWSNDLGIALTLQTGIETEANKQAQLALEEAKKEYKPLTDSISGYIKSPSSLIGMQANTVLQKQGIKETTYTGTLADAFDIFINTLSGKLLDKWLKKGLVTNFSTTGGSLTDPDAQNPSEGVIGAENRMRSLIEPNFKVRGDYDVLAELTICPDPNKAGPTDCVIDEKFREAIEKRLTVGQALEQGYLNGNGVFGFTSDGLEPKFNEGYPYRSMLILRKFRIIPMGWEVAAQKLKDQQSEIKGTKNLKYLVDCFSGGASWCVGLVDPSWVLKAPQNFCKKEGAGPEILSEQVSGEGADSSLSILRNETYCADEQSVIKEKSDGSGSLYGYCTEERRKWDFNGKSCEPRNNTCQTFASSDGQTVSYLGNTLDYGVCNAGNAGCKKYATTGSYDLASKTVAWNENNLIYLNKQAESCDAADEGCHEFVRVNSGGGANLLVNSDFEELLTSADWSGFGEQSDEFYQGAHSLKMSAPKTREITVGADDYKIAGENYVLSFYAKDCLASDKFYLEEKSADLSAGGDWARYSLTYPYPETADTNKIKFSIESSSCLIDNIKLEKGTIAGVYSDYAAAGSASLIYEKIAPSYLNCGTAVPPAECDNFSRYCSADEAGCELYTGVADNSKIPAKVMAQDYCPAECVGYNTYIQSETVLDSPRPEYFIPKTAKACSAEAVGCNQFTNLDEVAKGGEGIEYYTYLRQCLDKKSHEGSCAEFYNWEGSDESGYQLKVASLKTDGAGGPAGESAECTKDIYNYLPSNPAYNPDCRQYYNREGRDYYRLYKLTVSCSDDCHPYRRSALNYDDSLTQANCTGEDKHWDPAAESGKCVLCKNGGVWSADNNACLYLAVPGQGTTCAAAQSGCREYTGNTGNNIRNIFTDDFSGGTVGAWLGVGATDVKPSSDALILDSDNKGNSIKVSGGQFKVKRPVGSAVTEGKSYVLNFLAKASGETVLNLSLVNSDGDKAGFKSVSLTSGWQIFSANLASLNHKATSSEYLLLEAGSSYYIDNIILTEIVDRYYLIKDSWQTPESCYNDISGDYKGYLYNLGCAQYTDRASKTHNLRQFSKLCSESAVGCELMIDTQNSINPNAETFSAGVTVPKDSFAYVVYDSDKLCGSGQKGCERLGQAYKYDAATLYGDVYLKNDPDKYDTILCGEDAVGCQTFAYNNGASDSGETYFKDPGDMVCEWRQRIDEGQSYGWLKKKIKRCSGDGGAVCLTDDDCAASKTCLLETKDNACVTSEDKTFGFGGQGNRVSQPSIWTGVCPAADSGCSEYIDPLSKSNANLIFNGDFQALAGSITSGWDNLTQKVTLEADKVYRLGGALKIDGCASGKLYELGADNILTGPKTFIQSPSGNGRIFYFDSTDKGSCTVTATAGATGGHVELKPVIIDYQLRQNIDRQSCNGRVDNKNCVLFNERKQAGKAGLAVLNYDADATADGKPKSGAGNDSNLIVKVTPDRVCDKWLACRSYVKDEKGNNTCYDVGLCDAVDDNGDCQSFIASEEKNQTVDSLGASKISNLSGYAKVGLAGGGTLKTDYYPLGAMAQTGEMTEVSNGSFEYYGTNGYPIGWMPENFNPDTTGWNSGKFSVINNPVAAQTEGVKYPVDGKSFLKFSPSADNTWSEFIDVEPNTEYFISYKINTANFHTGTGFNYVGATMYVFTYKADGSPARLDGKIYGNDILSCNGTAAGDPWLYGCASLISSGSKGWEEKVLRFEVGPNTHRIKLRLGGGIWWGSKTGTCGPSHSCAEPAGKIITDPCSSSQTIEMTSDACAGNVYYDDIKIRPVLNSKENWHTLQNCRLYPKSDSLSCSYYEDSGAWQKGWPGYCLEYDRAPGDPNTCLLWYPVDKVKGDGVEEGSGYQGKIPVYYCLETQGACLDDGSGNKNTPALYCSKLVRTVNSVGQNKFWSSRVYKGTNYIMNNSQGFYEDWGSVKGGKEDIILDYNLLSAPFGSMAPPAPLSNPYEWDSIANTEKDVSINPVYMKQLPGDESHLGISYTSNKQTCEKIFDGETSSGCAVTEKNLGAWDQCKVFYPGSACAYPLSSCDRGGGKPDGSCCALEQLADKSWKLSVADPGPCDEPAVPRWSAICSSTIAVKTYDNLDEAQNSIKRIFTQSYGAWKWVWDEIIPGTGRYEQTDGIEWGVTSTDCNTTQRPSYVAGSTADICGIKPTVKNIKVNSLSSDVTFTANGFANLTFNTLVDGDQLPMVMYAVDWGDGEKTIVSGTEMSDRPNPDNPHSLYHLYSYWDLKAKANRGVKGVSCSASTCTVVPKIMIKDNWGWCNDDGRACNYWKQFDWQVVVKEK